MVTSNQFKMRILCNNSIVLLDSPYFVVANDWQQKHTHNIKQKLR